MLEILTRAGCFVAIIILGYVLRITLPAAIVSNFIGKEIDTTMLAISLIGLGAGLVYMGVAFLVNRRAGREKQIFEMVILLILL